VTQSILTSIKKILGISESDESFDIDILMHVNSVFSTLNQVGIGPDDGYMIEDSTDTWDAFLGTDKRLSAVKTYIYLRVRLLFDPPATSFATDSMKTQITELEWRLNVQREATAWTAPTS